MLEWYTQSLPFFFFLMKVSYSSIVTMLGLSSRSRWSRRGDAQSAGAFITNPVGPAGGPATGLASNASGLRRDWSGEVSR